MGAINTINPLYHVAVLGADIKIAADKGDWKGVGGAVAKAGVAVVGMIVGAKAAPKVGGNVPKSLPPKQYDIVPYWRSAPGFEKHHGILDAWARSSIPEYSSGAAPSVVLTRAQHNATRSVFNAWRAERGWSRVPIPWKELSPRDVQSLSYRMFEAAGVPSSVAAEYFRSFHQYLYGL